MYKSQNYHSFIFHSMRFFKGYLLVLGYLSRVKLQKTEVLTIDSVPEFECSVPFLFLFPGSDILQHDIGINIPTVLLFWYSNAASSDHI